MLMKRGEENCIQYPCRTVVDINLLGCWLTSQLFIQRNEDMPFEDFPAVTINSVQHSNARHRLLLVQPSLLELI